MHLKSLFGGVVCAAMLGAVYEGTKAEKDEEVLKGVAGSGPPPERAAVVAVLNDYLQVTDKQDQTAIAKAFHSSALLSSVTTSGVVAHLTQDDWWARVARIPKDTPSRESKIVLVDVVGVSGVARIDITDAQGSSSTDFFTLLKAKDGWRIVNKTLSSPL